MRVINSLDPNMSGLNWVSWVKVQYFQSIIESKDLSIETYEMLAWHLILVQSDNANLSMYFMSSNHLLPCQWPMPITSANSLDQDQAPQIVRPDLEPNC